MTRDVTLPLWGLGLLLAGAMLAAAAVTFLVIWAWLRHRGAGAPAPAPVAETPQARDPRVAPLPAPTSTDAQSQAALTQGMIGAFDLAANSPAVRSHLRQVLRGSGVLPLEVPEGAAFDPALHLAVDTEVGDAARSGLVARQVRLGWVRSREVLRPAEVIVWTS